MNDRSNHLTTMLALVACALLALGGCDSEPVSDAQPTDGKPAGSKTPAAKTTRIMPDDFVYAGAFRLPDVHPEHGWKWSGQALTFAADRPGGSLYGTGHDHLQHVSQISIPKPVISKTKNLKELPVAKTLRPFADVRGKMFGEMEQPRAGLTVLGERLYFCFAPHLDETGRGATHGSCPLTLKQPSAGPWRVGDEVAYVTADYMTTIPVDWAKAHVGGMRVATGRFRDGGQGAMGPALFAIDPAPGGKTPAAKAKIPCKTLLRYSAVDAEPPRHALKDYHHADEWFGAIWMSSGSRAAVAIVGSKGKGKCWYGFANGVVWPEEGPWPAVPAAPNDQRGWWSTSYSGQALLYDPADLAAVAAGKKKPHEPQPYAALVMDEQLYTLKARRAQQYVGAAAFDAGGGRLFVMEILADDDRPIVHVWQLKPGK